MTTLSFGLDRRWLVLGLVRLGKAIAPRLHAVQMGNQKMSILVGSLLSNDLFDVLGLGLRGDHIE
jgi:hypothetical protein